MALTTAVKGATPDYTSITDPTELVKAKSAYEAGTPVIIGDVKYNLPDVASQYSPVSPVSSSEPVRTEETINKNLASSLEKSISELDTKTTMDDIKAAIGWKDPNAALTADEQKAINEAGNRAGAEYTPEIQKAELAKAKGMPTATMSAGEQGGLMNTQYVGTRALQAARESGDWVGAGGELENIQSAYDRNIQQLNDAKLRAISLAKSKAEEAIRTGKESSNKEARELYSMAQEANTKAIEMAQAKVNLITGYQKQKQAVIDYNTDKINELATVGQPLDSQAILDGDAVMGDGWTQKYYDLAKKTTTAEAEQDQVKNLSEIYDLMKKVPIGKKMTFGDATFEGQYSDTADDVVYKVTTKSGEVALVTLDKATMKTKTIMTGVTEKGTTTGPGTPDISNDVTTLLATRGVDGYINTGEYAKLYDKYAAQGAKALADFVKRVTPEVYLNPQDPTAKKFLLTQTQALTGGPKPVTGTDESWLND